MEKARYLKRPSQKVGEGVPMQYHGTYPTKVEAERRAKSAGKALNTIWAVRKVKSGYAVYLA